MEGLDCVSPRLEACEVGTGGGEEEGEERAVLGYQEPVTSRLPGSVNDEMNQICPVNS